MSSNFTGDIKREIVRRGFDNACCKTAALSAFLRTTGSVIRKGDTFGFEFITESEEVAAFFIGILEELFGAELKVVQATTDIRSGRDRLVFQCLSDRSLYILSELGIAARAEEGVEFRLDMDKYVVENPCCEIAWIEGAFLGSGRRIPARGIIWRSSFPTNFWQTIAAAFWRSMSSSRGACRERAVLWFT